MRRFAIVLASLGVICSSIACQHTGGKCDCSPFVPNCQKYGLYTGDSAAEVAPTPKGEVLPPAKLKEMPATGTGTGM